MINSAFIYILLIFYLLFLTFYVILNFLYYSFIKFIELIIALNDYFIEIPMFFDI
jgi:hypothetical protein